MARHVDLDMRLSEWAAWREWQRRSADSAGPQRQLQRSDASGVLELDRAIARLPASLRSMLLTAYEGRTTLEERARRLNCPEATVVRRIGQAHRLLLDLLVTEHDDDAREQERGVMIARLSQSPGLSPG